MSFTLVPASDGSYTFDVVPGVPLDLPAVERALAEIGITADVRLDEICRGTPIGRLDSKQFDTVGHSDGTVSLTIRAKGFPSDATLSVALVLDGQGRLTAAGFAAYWTGTWSSCRRVSLGFDPTDSGTASPR